MQVKNKWVVLSPVLTEENSDLCLGLVHAFPLLYTELVIKTRQGALFRELDQWELISSL